jgi:biotin carboxylase
MNVVTEGGVFATQTLPPGHPEALALTQRTSALLDALGHTDGVCHAEYIRAEDGTFNFLEVASRVGGAHIAEMVEEATGVNLWREWANVVTLAPGEDYAVQPSRHDHAGLLVALAREEHPDMSGFDAPEVRWRIDKPYHVGLIVASEDRARTDALLDEYAARIAHDFAP